MKRIYAGPHAEVEVLGQVVAHGDAIEVTDEQAKSLDEQPTNWATPAKESAK